ncbi:ankyrin repeat domain-containing protein [Candidatus Dependentiae bacterium]|nr:ankyrin repeat domain-containing protein [Candidatus Dependentiae bacterium]
MKKILLILPLFSFINGMNELWLADIRSNPRVSSLFEAIFINDINKAREFIVEVHNVNSQGQTPLHSAIVSGNKDMIQLLMANGANVNAQDNYGNTPLHQAAIRKITSLKLLISAGANPFIQNKQNQTAFDRTKKDSELRQLLQSYMALQQEAESNPSSDTLSKAIELGCPLFVKGLLTVLKPTLMQIDCQLLIQWGKQLNQHYTQTNDNAYKQIALMLLNYVYALKLTYAQPTWPTELATTIAQQTLLVAFSKTDQLLK